MQHRRPLAQLGYDGWASVYIGATVWYAGAVGGALPGYWDCLADCPCE